jgi:hypothetical protein
MRTYMREPVTLVMRLCVRLVASISCLALVSSQQCSVWSTCATCVNSNNICGWCTGTQSCLPYGSSKEAAGYPNPPCAVSPNANWVPWLSPTLCPSSASVFRLSALFCSHAFDLSSLFGTNKLAEFSACLVRMSLADPCSVLNCARCSSGYVNNCTRCNPGFQPSGGNASVSCGMSDLSMR